HVSPHAPWEQTSPMAHVWPHIPQFAMSICVSTHSLPQRELPPLHWIRQDPSEQTSPGWHAAPQAPQFAGSLLTSMHAPPHFVWPGVHWVPVGSPPPPQLAASIAAMSAHRASQTGCFVRNRFIPPRTAMVPREAFLHNDKTDDHRGIHTEAT